MEKTVAKAFKVLEALSRLGRPIGVTQLAEQVAMNKSNVHRLLSTLVALGYARRNPLSEYEPSLKLWEIGHSVWTHKNLMQVASRHLDELAAKLGQTVLLAVLEGSDVLYIDKRDGSGTIRLTAATGERLQPHCSATGKVLLAFDSRGAERLEGSDLKRVTKQTIRSISELRSVLEQVRERGYAVNRDEMVEGLSGIAVPIKDNEGAVFAALGITMLTAQLAGLSLPGLVKSLTGAAQGISRDLHGRDAAVPRPTRRKQSKP